MREESIGSAGDGCAPGGGGGGGGGLPSIGEYAGSRQERDKYSPTDRGGAATDSTMTGVASHTIDEVMEES